MRFFCNLTLILFASTTQSFAQEERSYENTVAFLQQKLNTVDSYRTIRDFVERSRCNFSYVYSNNSSGAYDPPISGPSRKFSGWVTNFSASDLDPSRIAFEGSTVMAFARQSERLIGSQNIYYDFEAARREGFISSNKSYSACEFGVCEDEISMLNNIQFHGILGPENDNGPRVVRALRHLVGLCGGEEELF